ncbi:MAG: hypothetical protein U0840_19060 [Gemmataceae bacterium]
MSSEWQGRLLTGLLIVVGVGLGILGAANYPPISWMNDLQGEWLGFYSVKLSILLLFIMVGLPVLMVVGIVKAVRGEVGQSSEPPAPQHPAMRPPGASVPAVAPRSRPQKAPDTRIQPPTGDKDTGFKQ